MARQTCFVFVSGLDEQRPDRRQLFACLAVGFVIGLLLSIALRAG